MIDKKVVLSGTMLEKDYFTSKLKHCHNDKKWAFYVLYCELFDVIILSPFNKKCKIYQKSVFLKIYFTDCYQMPGDPI